MKFKNLLFHEHSELLNDIFENARIKNDISREQFTKLLSGEGQNLFTDFDEWITSIYLKNNTLDISDFLKKSHNNLKGITNRNKEAFTYFFTYLKFVQIFYENLSKNLIKGEVRLKDKILIVLYGNLFRQCDQIGMMLTNGYIDGALRIWRSFYEHAVITIFLAKHYSDELAEKFVDFSYKSTKKKIKGYLDRREQIQLKKVNPNLEYLLEKNDEALELKYGKDFFKKDYNWAKEYLPETEINFRSIEKYVEMERFRPFYVWASEYCHPNFTAMSNFREDSDTILLDTILEQETEKERFNDPMVMTLGVFDHVNIDVLFLYSDEYEYDTNLLMFRKILDNLQRVFA